MLVKKDYPQALTLVELLVAISIIAILAAVSIIGFQATNVEDTVSDASDLIVNALYKARNSAIAIGSDVAVCELQAAKTATCSSNTTWTNINGSVFNSKLKVTSTNAQVSFNDRGFAAASNTFTITPVTTAACSQKSSKNIKTTINLWQNSVIQVTNDCE